MRSQGVCGECGAYELSQNSNSAAGKHPNFIIMLCTKFLSQALQVVHEAEQCYSYVTGKKCI